VCPTDPVDVVTASDGKRYLTTMRWGLVPSWWSKPLKELRMAIFNARAETVETKPVFCDAFKRSRCLIPMSGYYEWQNTPSGKQPWYFTSADGSPLLTAAGLWDEWKKRETGEKLRCERRLSNGLARSLKRYWHSNHRPTEFPLVVGPSKALLRVELRSLGSCTMIITESNDFVAKVHDRMPALLS
jgi:putative SOS response-associated peptidase YedK